ncbi:MAG TPA: 1-(5-phosphoribosyl)-5-[(5-phosphoribosylamino)methylideneamino]imidazole-4-carboxamide isomerase [Planctomycetaceae bacterium]|nr:1-(5-phosphoribosyl)-5-[(5-phosphoribosylamino)methylideneamino]imidazole-4-carboxamide isomerase [Planctomycetaceae bacterium]
MQLLPAIDLLEGRCVRLRQGNYEDSTVFSDDPVEMALRWQQEGAERLHLVDLDGARAGRPVNQEVVRQIVQRTGLPCQLGGGIRDEQSIRATIEQTGVDRVIIGTKALRQPDWFAEMCGQFPDRLALGLDARNSMVATDGWLEVSQVSALELARRFVGLPLAAVIYTNIANDGMMQGIDAATLQDFRTLAAMGLPVIASGGVTTMADLVALKAIAAEQPGLIGAITGRAIYEGTISVRVAVDFLRGAE